MLSNILLNELDKELVKRGHRYVRYADDFSIYVKSKRAAKRVFKSINMFLTTKLQLLINKEKSGIRRPTKLLMKGWLNYFKLTASHNKLKSLDEWLRNRLRYCIWHDWKKPDQKRKNLIRLGVAKGMAYAWSRTRLGGWRVAQSPMLKTTITLKRLQQRGYETMLSYYYKLKESIGSTA